MVTTWPRGTVGLSAAAERLAKRITQASAGRLTVKLFAANELVKAFDSFEAVSSGKAEMYHAAEYYWQNKHKGFNFFATVPLGMTSQELEAWVHFGGGQQLWDELAGQFNLKCLMAANTGVQMGGWFKDPIRSAADFKNLKMRIPGLGGEVVRRMGGTAITLPGGEIFNSLKSGKINATEWVGPYMDKDFGLHKILKNYMFPGFHEPGTCLSLGINRTFWDNLPEDDRVLIQACASAENDISMAEFTARNGLSLADLTQNYGIKLRIFPRDVWKSLAKISGEVVREVASIDRLGQRIYQSFDDFQKRISFYQQISEVSFSAYRALALDR
ncbi:MAG: TRAP transporter substrate-binding protein [Pseudomonadota bacterium]